MPAAVSLWAASRAPVYQDTVQMDITAQVCQLKQTCFNEDIVDLEKCHCSFSYSVNQYDIVYFINGMSMLAYTILFSGVLVSGNRLRTAC